MRSTQPRPVDDGRTLFPHDGSPEQIWRFLLRFAVTAPSGHNTQPWRFGLHDARLALYADRSRRLPVVDPEDRALVISCGAALAHLTVAMRHHGYAGDVSLFPDPGDPDLLATVGLGQGRTAGPSADDLFDAIGARHTHRAPFQTRPVPRDLLTRLETEARRAGTVLHVLAAGDAHADVAALVAEGDRTQFSDPDFRRELAAWVRPNRTRRRDGVPGYAFGIADLPSLLGPTMIATFDTGASQARKDEELARSAPALLVLSTPGDTAGDWLAAGQAVALVLLRATAHGLSASFLNQPVEVPALRERLADLLGGEDAPQLLLRVGYGTASQRPTPRRSVDDVLHGVSAGSETSS